MSPVQYWDGLGTMLTACINQGENMTNLENQAMDTLSFMQRVLDWNRAQENPPIEITKEYYVALELLALFEKRNYIFTLEQLKEMRESKYECANPVHDILNAQNTVPTTEPKPDRIASLEAEVKCEEKRFNDLWDMYVALVKRVENEPAAWQVMVGNEAAKEFTVKDMAHNWAKTQELNGSPYTYWIRPLYALDEVTK